MSRLRRLTLFQRFVSLGLAVMVVIGLGLGFVLANRLEARAIQAAADETSLLAEAAIAPVLRKGDLEGLNPARAVNLDRLVRTRILPRGVVEVKLWNRDGRVVYSSRAGVAGKTFPVSGLLENALNGAVGTRVEHPDAIEHPAAGGERALEIYVPLHLGGSLVGAFEIYRPYEPIAASITAEQMRLYAVLAVGLLVLFALLGRVVLGASRTLARQADELTELYEKEHDLVTRISEVDEMKTDIVAAVSHELRTPLTTIHGAIETVLGNQKALKSAQRTELLHVALRGSERLERLVTELLEVPRIYSGDLRVRLEPLDIADILGQAVARHRDVVRVVIPPNPPEVVSDRGVVKKVLELLVNNAVKFSPEGSPVTIRLRERSDSVSISVEDEGPGIPPGQEERIFAPFYQADHHATRSAGGVGLGLHLARTLASLVDATIEVDRRRRKGSKFVLTLARQAPWALPPNEVVGALRASSVAAAAATVGS